MAIDSVLVRLSQTDITLILLCQVALISNFLTQTGQSNDDKPRHTTLIQLWKPAEITTTHKQIKLAQRGYHISLLAYAILRLFC